MPGQVPSQTIQGPKGQLPALADHCNAPAELCAVVEKALAPNAADRWSSPTEVADMLTPYTKDADLRSVLAQAQAFPLSSTHVGGLDSTQDDVSRITDAASRRSEFSWARTVVPAAILIVLAAGLAAALALTRPSWPQWEACKPGDLAPIWSDARIEPQIEALARGEGETIRISADARTFLDVGAAPDETYRLKTSLALDAGKRAGLFFGARAVGGTIFRTMYVQVWRSDEPGSEGRFVVTLRRFSAEPHNNVPVLPADEGMAYGEFVLPPARTSTELEISVSGKRIEVYFAGRHAITADCDELSADSMAPIGGLAGQFGVYLHAGNQDFSQVQFMDR
jgi:hypothetical protein